MRDLLLSLMRTGILKVNHTISDLVFDDSVYGLYRDNKFESFYSSKNEEKGRYKYYDYIVALKMHLFTETKNVLWDLGVDLRG